jgi:MFS family permease
MLASANTVVQVTAGDHIRGRVMSVYFMVYLLSAAAGGPLIGSIDQHLGPRVGLLIIGAVPGTVIGLVGLRLALLTRRPRDAPALTAAGDLGAGGGSAGAVAAEGDGGHGLAAGEGGADGLAAGADRAEEGRPAGGEAGDR